MKKIYFFLIAFLLLTFVSLQAYDPYASLDYAMCGYGGAAACNAMGYSPDMRIISLIEPTGYQDVNTYPMSCIDMGTGWCGEAQSFDYYQWQDNSWYWNNQYSNSYYGYNYDNYNFYYPQQNWYEPPYDPYYNSNQMFDHRYTYIYY